ncbi:hypothetical protein GCM10025792_24890 [Pseudonocardia tropica]
MRRGESDRNPSDCFGEVAMVRVIIENAEAFAGWGILGLIVMAVGVVIGFIIRSN